MSSVPRRLPPERNERGIVLAAALLFVLLTSVLVLTFMATTTGERSQSSNVQTAKLSLYAADAGVRAQQQILANVAQTKLDSCLTRWTNAGATGAIVQHPELLFPSGVLGGTNAASASSPPFTATASISFADSDCTPQSQAYNYIFNISATGNVHTSGKRSVQSQGLLRVSATRGTFADYLMYMNNFVMNDGSTIWFTSSGSFDGRVHTNTNFRFAFKPTFQDQITQVGANATYYNNGSPVNLNANNNGTVDVPNFYGGFLRSQTSVPMPTNSFSQQGGALGITGSRRTPPRRTTRSTWRCSAPRAAAHRRTAATWRTTRHHADRRHLHPGHRRQGQDVGGHAREQAVHPVHGGQHESHHRGRPHARHHEAVEQSDDHGLAGRQLHGYASQRCHVRHRLDHQSHRPGP